MLKLESVLISLLQQWVIMNTFSLSVKGPPPNARDHLNQSLLEPYEDTDTVDGFKRIRTKNKERNPALIDSIEHSVFLVFIDFV